MMPSTGRPFAVGLLLIDGFALMSYASVVEPLRAANLLAGHTLYEITHLAAGGAEAVSSAGARVADCRPIGGDGAFDLLLVVAGGDPSAFGDRRVFDWLRYLARRGARIGGVSGGPVILAAAGIMAGRRMTVHWEHAEALARMPGPLALALERSLYVIDRDRITCAGGTAPLDLMHSLIAEHHGPAFARRVSDWFMHTEVRPAGGPQRAGLAERYRTTNPAILNAIEAMQNHIADTLDMAQLARLAGIGPRQLNRLFHDRMGLSTMRFYRGLRLEKAAALLGQTGLGITDIALTTGFASSAHFSRAFRERFATTPSAFRRQAGRAG